LLIVGGAEVTKESVEYLRQRELAERAAAESASSDAARRVHQELAQNYAALLQEQQLSETRTPLRGN
jgi:hypothetical protein